MVNKTKTLSWNSQSSQTYFMVGFGFNFACISPKCISGFESQKQTQDMINHSCSAGTKGSNVEVERVAARKNLSHTEMQPNFNPRNIPFILL